MDDLKADPRVVADWVSGWVGRLLAGQDSAEIAAGLSRDAGTLARAYALDPGSVERAHIQIRSVAGMAKTADLWFRTVKREARAAAAEQASAARREATAGDMHPLDAITRGLGVSGLMAPAGYSVDLGGVLDSEGRRVIVAPVVIAAVEVDAESGGVRFDLAWLFRGRWVRRSIERDAALDARRVLRLAEYGLPVSSGSCAPLVRYLEQFEACNAQLIPERATIPRMGWVGPSLVVGSECYGPPVSLVADEGLAALAGGFGAVGDPAEWSEMAEAVICPRPSVLLACYVAAASPMLEILGIPGFIADWSGATSRGKSTALKIAASVWGCWGDVVMSWGTSSAVGPQEMAAFSCNLPVFLDDTKEAEDRPQILERVTYAIPAGREQARGRAAGGLRKARTWRLILLSTGENALASFSGSAGARARLLCIVGAPFGSDTEANRAAAEMAETVCLESFGHVGASLARFLAECDREAVRARYAVLRDQYSAAAGGSVSRRLGRSVAAVDLVSRLLADLGFPASETQRAAALDVAWESALSAGADSDQPAKALESVLSWAAANAERFWGARNRMDPPALGWLGIWFSGDSWAEIGCVPADLSAHLDRAGFDSRYVISEWARRGVLLSESGRRRCRRMIDGRRVWLFVFSRAEVDRVLGA